MSNLSVLGLSEITNFTIAIDSSSVSSSNNNHHPHSSSGTSNSNNNINQSRYFWWENGRAQIPLYTIIFLLAVIGNSLVILTLVQNQRMRTITNVFLLNLAVSDLLLGVLCMPFTLIGTILRDFVFGEVMCKLVPYLQACSVSVSVWTLVAISVERYYAICHPLRSRRWQTLSHSYRLIVAIWTCSFLIMSPIAGLSELIPTSTGLRKCRETWPGNGEYERAYNLILDAILLIVPLLVLGVTYTLVTRTLCRSDPLTMSTLERSSGQSSASCSMPSVVYVTSKGRKPLTRCSSTSLTSANREHNRLLIRGSGGVGGVGGVDCQPSGCTIGRDVIDNDDDEVIHTNNKVETKAADVTSSATTAVTSASNTVEARMCQQTPEGRGILSRTKSYGHASTDSWQDSFGRSKTLRRTNPGRALARKKRIVKMLLVVVLEFFVCWTPLYVINTLALFSPMTVYDGLGSTGISFLQLLAYSSSCCNPITYCFMNDGFRKSFLSLFKRCDCCHEYCTSVGRL